MQLTQFRSFLVWLHRWSGLLMTAFLIIVGLTGSVLAFREPLDVWLNPGILSVPKRNAPLLDPFVLRDRAAALHPGDSYDQVQLHLEPDRSVRFGFMPSQGTGIYMQDASEFFLDPYTGANLGERHVYSSPSLERKNVISFLYRLHFALAWPWKWSTGSHSPGARILGYTALLWTIDCIVAFYLTLPRRLRLKREEGETGRSWWARWKPAWLIKFQAEAIRINFDIHRAFGLWTWVLLFIFAWSSVGFNLDEAFTPTMRVLFGASPPAPAGLPARAEPLKNPVLDWHQARARGSELLQAEAKRRGQEIKSEESISIDRDTGSYVMVAHGSRELGKAAESSVTFDANTGQLLAANFPGDIQPALVDQVTNWLFLIHLAAVFGLPMQVLVFLIGIVMTVLSVTGVHIWWKKRRARRHARANTNARKSPPTGDIHSSEEASRRATRWGSAATAKE